MVPCTYVQTVASASAALSEGDSYCLLHWKPHPKRFYEHFRDAHRRSLTMRFVKQAAAVLCTVIFVITVVFDTQISTNALDITTPMKSATEKFFILGSGSYTRKLILTNAGQSETVCGLS